MGSEILAQLKKLSDGMALIRQDVDALKRESSFQPCTSEEVVDDRGGDDTTDDSVQPSGQPLANSSGGLAAQDTTALNQGSLWAEEMDVRDPLLDDDLPTKGAVPINVVPVTERIDKFLNEAFTLKMTGADRRFLRSLYTLPQNQLTRTHSLTR